MNESKWTFEIYYGGGTLQQVRYLEKFLISKTNPYTREQVVLSGKSALSLLGLNMYWRNYEYLTIELDNSVNYKTFIRKLDSFTDDVYERFKKMTTKSWKWRKNR